MNENLTNEERLAKISNLEKAKMMFQINKRFEQENTNKETQNKTDFNMETKNQNKNYLNKIIDFQYFKFSIIIVLIGFLYVYYEYSQNGRYYINSDGIVIDTRTGKTYIHHSNLNYKPHTTETIVL